MPSLTATGAFRWGRRCWRSQCCYLHCLCTRVLNIKILLVLNTTNINTKHQLITSRMCSTHMMPALKLLHAGAILSFFSPHMNAPCEISPSVQCVTRCNVSPQVLFQNKWQVLEALRRNWLIQVCLENGCYNGAAAALQSPCTSNISSTHTHNTTIQLWRTVIKFCITLHLNI